MGMRASLEEGGSQSAHPNSLKRTPYVQIWHSMSKRGWYFWDIFILGNINFFPLLLLLFNIHIFKPPYNLFYFFVFFKITINFG